MLNLLPDYLALAAVSLLLPWQSHSCCFMTCNRHVHDGWFVYIVDAKLCWGIICIGSRR